MSKKVDNQKTQLAKQQPNVFAKSALSLPLSAKLQSEKKLLTYAIGQ